MQFLKCHDNLAMVSTSRSVTYGQLLHAAHSCAGSLPIQPGDRAAIFSENRLEWPVAFYATWQCQGIPVPIDFMSAVDEVAHIIRDSEPSVVFCSQDKKADLDEALAAVEHVPEVRLLDDLVIPEDDVSAEPLRTMKVMGV